MTLLLAPWKWLSVPAVVALATATGTALVGPPGPDDGPQAPAAANLAPPARRAVNQSLSSVEFGGPVTIAGRDGKKLIQSKSLRVEGKVGGLAQLAEQLQGSDPNTTFRLEVSGGQLRLDDDSLIPPTPIGGEPAPAKPEPPKPAEKAEEWPEEVVPPLVRLPKGQIDLGPNPPAGYFDPPAADPSNPNTPRPVQVGQKIRVEVLEALPGRPLTGTRVVRPDGTISLGFYGDLAVVGLNRDQIKVNLIEKLRHYLLDRALGLVGYKPSQAGRTQAVAVPPVESDRVFVDDQPDPNPAAPIPDQAPRRPAAPPARLAPVPEAGRPAPAPLAPGQASTLTPRLEAALTGDRLRHSGQSVFYRLAVTNAGAAPTADLRVVVRLPSEGGRLARLPDGAKFVPSHRTLNWDLARLEPGQTFEQQFAYDTSTPGSYRCTLEVATGDFRADDVRVTEVSAVAALDLKVSQTERIIDVGKSTHYDFVIKNFGTKEATNLRLGGRLMNLKVVKMFAGDVRGQEESKPESGGQPAQFMFPAIPRLGPSEATTLSLEVEALRGPQASASVDLTYNEMDGEAGLIRGVIATRVFQPGAAKPATPSPPVEVGQTLVVEVLEALPGRPIMGEHVVRPDGTISLGFYGDVPVAGLTRDEVKVKVIEHLRKSLKDEALGLKVADPSTGQTVAIPPLRSDRVLVDRADFDPARVARGPGPDGRVQVGQLVAVEVLEALPNRPITGERLVGPDGRINLGFYGDVAAAGLTRAELKVRVIDHLRGKLTDEQLGLIADDGRGDRRPVAPADSTRVYVDDVLPAPQPEGEVERLRREVAELNGKLNGVYHSLDRLGRDRPAPAPKVDSPPKP